MTERFITFEGIDGAGKSTHVSSCVRSLRSRGFEVVLTREPGGSALAEQLRTLMLHEPMDLLTETLLMFAARRDHIEQTVRPALARGAWVVCDRFTDSTFAYQGAGRGGDWQRIAQLAEWVQGDLQPSRTFLFDLDPAEAARRRGEVRAPDRFEAESQTFFEAIRRGYLRRAEEEPARFVVIDASRSIEDISIQLEQIFASL